MREHRRIWVHAVSVGEIYVALRFIKAYRLRHPDCFFALSTTTSTAHAIGRKELDSRDVLFYFPVDLPVIIRKVLRIVNPTRIVLVEGEFWPNLIRLANKQGVPISLVNGRMSESSFNGYRKLRSLTADVLRCIQPICVQGNVDAERLMGIGAPEDQVHVMGSVKFDVAERNPEGERAALEVLRRFHVPEDAVVLLGGSTWPGEELVLVDLYQRLRAQFSKLFLVLVPRHVERSPEVVNLLNEKGVSFVRRSELELFDGNVCPDLLLVDTTGELRSFYAHADIVFVGKSLTEEGGQNPIEPALAGAAVVVGPNMDNFPAVMNEMLESNAVLQVATAEELELVVERLAGDEAERSALGARASAVILRNQGTIERTVELLGK